MNITKLTKMLCPKNNCKGYLFETHDKHKNDILRCKNCNGFIHKPDYDILILTNKNSYEVNDEVDNLEALNKLVN